MLSVDQQQTFLQMLHDLPLEEGKAYIRGQKIAPDAYTIVGEQIKDEALRQWHIDTSVSLKLGELLIFFGEYTGHAPSRALGFVAKGDALKLLGHYQSAKECLDVAGKEFLRLGREVDWARTRMSWIPVVMWVGNFEAALREAEEARRVFMKHKDEYWVCAIEHNKAVIYKRQGRYREACDIYEHIRSVYPNLLNQDKTVIKRAIAMAEANEALTVSLLGEFERASQLLMQARTTFDDLHEVGAVIKVDVHLAELDYVQGYYGSALSRYYKTRDTMLSYNLTEGPMSMAELNIRLANCLIKLDRAEEASKLAEEAVTSYRKIGVSLDTGEALREYAVTLMALGRHKDALRVLDEAEKLFTQSGFDHYASMIKIRRAELHLILGHIDIAYNEAMLVKEFSDARDFIENSIRANIVIIGVLIEKAVHRVQDRDAQLQNAMLLCQQTTKQARRCNLQEHVYKAHHIMGKIAMLQGFIDKAVRYYALAIAQIERILDNLAHDLSPAFLHTAWSVYEDMIAILLKQERIESAFIYLERARSVVLRQYLNRQRTLQNGEEEKESASLSQGTHPAVLQVQRELEEWQGEYRRYSQQLANYDSRSMPFINKTDVENELRRCEQKLSELFERVHLYELAEKSPSSLRTTRKKVDRSIDVTQIRQHLSSTQLVLSYFLYQETLVIFLITAEGLSHYELPVDMVQLERLLILLPAHLEPQGWSNSQQPPQQAILRLLQKLYAMLLGPIEHVIKLFKHITIVPYGILHRIPFHALHTGTHFLIEDFQVSYLPTTSILAALEAPEAKEFVDVTQANVSSAAPLLFGYSGNGYLQRAVDEAKALAAMLEGRCFLEEDATIKRLIQESQNSSIIHLATHGHSRLDAPNFSSILLADGQLNALDVFGLNLKNCELVTLSGCETGLSLSGGGDEQIGLGRAFLAAGAFSLVMSLWPVEDAATSTLMQHFYRNLLAGETKVQALRHAQCELITLSPRYSHPYFWAAFRLVGNGGPLHKNKA